MLINISGGADMTLFEVDEAANRIKEEVDPDANIIVGSTLNETLEGEMRVSVVATGIEMRPTTTESTAAAQPEPKAAALTVPSFRLRAQAGKPETTVVSPSKAALEAATAGAAAEVAARATERPPEPSLAGGDVAAEQATGREVPPSTAPKPAEGPVARAKGMGWSEPGVLHPPLPPQERFQEWGKLRAPVRDVDRPPSLFERVTASFARGKERTVGDLGTAVAEPEVAERQLVSAEEESYDIPAFLRR